MDSDRHLSTVEFLDQSAFDEKFEVCLEEDRIRNIYHIENKYYVPVLQGGFRKMYQFAKENMVHPEEDIFHQLLDPDTLAQRLSDPQNGGMLKAECREKLIDGSYRWVQYLAIFGELHGVPEGLIYFYVYDIQNQKDRESGKIASTHYSQEKRDPLTGLIGSDDFIKEASRIYDPLQGPWCCLAIDVQHFKVFNAWFGREKGTYVIARIGTVLREIEERQQQTAVAAYCNRDNFALFMKYDEELIKTLYEDIKEIIAEYSNTLGFLPAIGVNILEPGTTKIDYEMYEKARIGVVDAKQNYIDRIRLFDREDYERKRKEYELMTDFRTALKNEEISFFIQPQCWLSDGRIIGGEALVRWIKPDGTVIGPGAFVPFLEQHGFITLMDKAVWQAVVKWLHNLIDRNIKPIPVSINVSQVDLQAMDVVAYLYALMERYNVPTKYLKVEITESAYADNYELISQTVEKLKEKGFQVYMDDFGSGYSSLNMLDTINTDVIKLDMIFMRKKTSLSKKGISILEAIVSMTKTLSIPIIIEGAENEEQVAFLKNLGCRYVQGYYFYKPMPVAAFEQLLQDPEKVDFGGIKARQTEMFHTKEFLNEAFFTDSILNNVLGPVAFYVQDKQGNLNILRYNQQFYECISDVNMDQRKTAIHNYILKQDHPQFYKMLEDASKDPVHGGQCTVRFMKSGGGVFWYYMHLFLLKEDNGEKIFYGKISNATGMYQQGAAFFDLLRMNSDSCMRIDLKDEMIYVIEKNKSFDDPDALAMKAADCLRLTADARIPDLGERERFVEFFQPERLKKSHEAGIYCEAFKTNFILGKELTRTLFSAYYIKFLPSQEDNVYIFANKDYNE